MCQIIKTSHDLGPQNVAEDQGNLGWWSASGEILWFGQIPCHKKKYVTYVLGIVIPEVRVS